VIDTVAKRYATALFQIALEQQLVEQIDNEAEDLAVICSDREVMTFFTSPRIPALAKKQAVDRLFTGRFDRSVINLVKLLIDKNRINALPSIMRYFDLLTDSHRGVEVASIFSAVPLDDGQVAAMVTELKRFSDYDNLEVRTVVDGGLLGGVKIRLGENLVIDGTVATRLKEMQERLYRYRHKGTGA